MGGLAAARRRASDDGATLVEYALIVALIAIVCIVALQMVGDNSSRKVKVAGSAIDRNGVGSTYNMRGTCDEATNTCTISVANTDPNWYYAYKMPDGTVQTRNCPVEACFGVTWPASSPFAVEVAGHDTRPGHDGQIYQRIVCQPVVDPSTGDSTTICE